MPGKRSRSKAEDEAKDEPKDEPTYAKKAYWESRYGTAKEDGEEWYFSFAELEPLIERAAVSKSSRIVEVGCGDRPLLADFRKNGFSGELIGIDFAPSVIELLQKNNAVEGITFAEMDARNLQLETASCDIVIDKGTIDAMLCSETGMGDAHAIVAEAARVLRTPGWLIIISHIAPGSDAGVELLSEAILPGLRSESSSGSGGGKSRGGSTSGRNKSDGGGSGDGGGGSSGSDGSGSGGGGAAVAAGQKKRRVTGGSGGSSAVEPVAATSASGAKLPGTASADAVVVAPRPPSRWAVDVHGAAEEEDDEGHEAGKAQGSPYVYIVTKTVRRHTRATGAAGEALEIPIRLHEYDQA